MNVTAIDRYYMVSDVVSHLTRNGYEVTRRADTVGLTVDGPDMWVYTPNGELSRSFMLTRSGQFVNRRDYDGWCKYVGIVPLTNEIIADIQ